MNSRVDFGWAVVRAAFGAALAGFHGYGKVFEGKAHGLARTVAEMGMPHPLFWAWCASLAEFVGGILVCLGLLTRPAAAVVTIAMGVALAHHHWDIRGDGELAAHYLVVMLVAVVIGGGRWSLDRMLRVRWPIALRRVPPPQSPG